MTDKCIPFPSTGQLSLTIRFILPGHIRARRLMAGKTKYFQPFAEIFVKMFRLFPFNEFRDYRLVRPFLPCDRGFVLTVF